MVVPFHFIAEALIKFVPVTVRVNEPLPASALFGSRVFIMGKGLLVVMVNVSAELVPPPGDAEKTVTAALPEVDIFAAGTAAVNIVGLI